MDVESKDLITWGVMIFGFAITYGRATSKQDDHGRRIGKLEKIMESNDDGGPPFITFDTHSKLQESCQKQINTELGHIKTDISEIKDTMKNGNQSREDARNETSQNFKDLQTLILASVKPS